MEELLLTVDRATKVQALRQENTALRQELEGKFNFDGMVGKNEQMRQVLEKVKLVATTDATVLIFGESGNGEGSHSECDSPEQPARRTGPH